jgi:hypothetical protein
MTPSASRSLRTSRVLASFLTSGKLTFTRSFIFMNIAGCTFILRIEIRSHEPEVRIVAPSARHRHRTFRVLASSLTMCAGNFTHSFVFMNIAGCTFIFDISFSAGALYAGYCLPAQSPVFGNLFSASV